MNPASASLLAGAPESAVHTPPVARRRSDSAALPVAVLGVPFDHVTIGQAIARIDAMVASRRSHYVVTANVDFLVQAHRDVELRRILLEADLVLCDGAPVLWASRWLGNALPERVAGSDLAPALVQAAAEKGHRIFLLGAAPGVAAAAGARLKQQYPALKVAGTYAPPFSRLLEMDHDEIARRVRAARPDILLVSFGCPKQEKWIAMHHRALGVPVAIGVGATLDFLAGRVKRAPAWMRRTGTEWLYRLGQEPKRLYRRYASDLFHFLPTLSWQRWHLAGGGENSESPHENAFAATGSRTIEMGSELTRRSLEGAADFWQNARDPAAAHWLLDLSHVRAIDGTGVAFLIRCRKERQAAGKQLALLAPSACVERVLTTMRLWDHFIIARNRAEAAQRVSSPAAPAVRSAGTTRFLEWSGEVVAANREDVWQMTTDHVRALVANHATLIIIDLSRLRFIDSSGASLMLRLKRWAPSLQVEVLFAHAQPNIRNVLQLTHLDLLLLEGAQ